MDVSRRIAQAGVVKRHATLLLVLAGLLVGEAAAQNSNWSIHQRLGDDQRWAAPNWDDRDWAEGNNVPARTGIYWVRFRFTLRGIENKLMDLFPACTGAGLVLGNRVDSVYMAAPYSYEFYWDGHLIGHSGVVGATRETEVVDRLDHVFVIPPELLGAGEHVVAMRLSTFHYNFPAEHIDVGFVLGDSAEHFLGEMQHLALPLIGAGGAGLVAILSLLLYLLVGRWRPLLLCSLSSLALMVFYVLIACRWLRQDPYDWFYPRLLTITYVTAFIGWTFPWLLLEQFALRRRAWWLAALTCLMVAAWTASPFYEFKALWLCRAMLLVSVGIAAWAAWRRRPGAWFVLAGAAAALMLVRADRRDFLNHWFFVTFSLLVLYVFTLVGLQLRADRRRAQAALLETARLETELLKKNMQPHFLLNTLTAVSEVIDRDPQGAVKFIEDLAAEFRSLTQMSGEKLVPLKRELDLCEAHLKVISRRTGRNYELLAEGVERETLVPPAIFLTLIENGLVHQQTANGATFQLLGRAAAGGVSYAFVSPGDTRKRDGRLLGGTGLRYVRARLEESFPGSWTFSHGAVERGWETIIGWRTTPAAGGAA
ncbi:MAG TPA: histidine kinase [Candidatus Didemnitutus sp.]|nr:histidine kinase [Candidatus Didemnitutus sp.]